MNACAVCGYDRIFHASYAAVDDPRERRFAFLAGSRHEFTPAAPSPAETPTLTSETRRG